MNKIAIILSQNTHWSPYYSRYEKILCENGYQFDLIIWNREGIDEKVKGNMLAFNKKDKTNDGSILKIFKFFSFSRFVKYQLKKNDYSKVFFVGTYAFLPAILCNFLKKNYKNRYWIDLRDLTYETIRSFYKLEEKAINNSYFTVISSKGFLNYLPKYGYGYIHNIDPSMNDICNSYKKIISKEGRIRIAYIGNLSYWATCKEMIDVLANNDNFEMRFIGPGYEKIQKYCIANNINNVYFHGKFERKETVYFYNEADLIYNIYGNDSINVRTALSNKLYYALAFKIPIIVSENTYMEDFCKKYNIGITFKKDNSFPAKLLMWYNDFPHHIHLFEQAWKDVIEEDANSENKIIEFLRKKI